MWMLHVIVLKPLEELTVQQIYNLKCFVTGPNSFNNNIHMCLEAIELLNAPVAILGKFSDPQSHYMTLFDTGLRATRIAYTLVLKQWNCFVQLVCDHSESIQKHNPFDILQHWPWSFKNSVHLCPETIELHHTIVVWSLGRAHLLTFTPSGMLRWWLWSYESSPHMGFETLWMLHMTFLKHLEKLTCWQLYNLTCFGICPEASRTTFASISKPLSCSTQQFCRQWGCGSQSAIYTNGMVRHWFESFKNSLHINLEIIELLRTFGLWSVGEHT